jgi:EmrB/QacA subfamily drug resistance transporter
MKDILSSPWFILINVLLSTFLAIFSVAATIIAEGNIQGDLALSESLSQWVTTIYLLGVNTMVPAATRFADRFLYKRVYAAGVLIFVVGSGLTPLVASFPWIAACRFVEGLGAGAIFPVGMALIVRHFPKERIAIALCLYIGIAFGGGLGIGLFLAGYLAQFYTWHLIFYGVIPIGLLLAFSCYEIKEEQVPIKHPFDIWGWLCLAFAIASLLVAVSNGALSSTAEGWRAPWILACLSVFALSTISLIVIEGRHPEPIIPMRLFRDPIFSASATALFLLGMALFAGLSTSEFFLIEGIGYERYIAGAIGMSYGITIALFSIIAGALRSVIPTMVLALTGLGCLVVSYFLNHSITWQCGWREILPLLILRGMGVGLALGPTTAQALKSVPEVMGGTAATLLTFFRQVGGTFGGAFFTVLQIRRAIFHNVRFGEQANQWLPGYRVALKHVETRMSQLLSQGVETSEKANAILIANIKKQAFIQGLNDACFIFGWITLVVAIILLVLSVRAALQKKATTAP